MENIKALRQGRSEGINKADRSVGTKNNSHAGSQADFKDLLIESIGKSEVKISQHAAKRISSRDICITDKQMEDINIAVSKASDKGIKESLVLINDTALIVSIRNKTIITAMESDNLKERIVTNIDGAIII